MVLTLEVVQSNLLSGDQMPSEAATVSTGVGLCVLEDFSVLDKQ